MNRRNFLKTTGIIGMGVFAPIHNLFANIKTNTEVDDLYRYLESKTINTPIQGVIPFKLYPFQKDILKAIHENDRLVIVKCRQIGMTTLLAGYAAWLSHQKNICDPYHSCNRDMFCYYRDLTNRFDYIGNGGIAAPPRPYLYSPDFMLSYFDEINYTFRYWNPTQIIQDNVLNGYKMTKKIVISGSVDSDGQMRKIVELANNNPKWKVLYYPWDKCYPMWFKARRDFYIKSRNKIGYEVYNVNRELNCEFC